MRASVRVREGRNRNRTDDRLNPSGRFLVDGSGSGACSCPRPKDDLFTPYERVAACRARSDAEAGAATAASGARGCVQGRSC